MNLNLSSKAMLARVSIRGTWSAVGEDEQASADLAKHKGIRPGVYRAIKGILDPKKVPALKQFNSARSTLYTLHRQLTLAWDDKAGRMLPMGIYWDYMTKVGEAKQRCIDTYTVLMGEIPTLKQQFQSDPETAAAYSEADWPDVQEQLDKFQVRVHVEPLADASDFRCQIGDQEVARIKAECEQNMGARLAGGLAELIGELKGVVEDAAMRFQKYHDKEAKTFHDTAITNVRGMVEKARKLNVIGDANLDKLFDEVDAVLCNRDPQVIRDNYVEREQTISASNILARKLAAVESVLFQQAEAA